MLELSARAQGPTGSSKGQLGAGDQNTDQGKQLLRGLGETSTETGRGCLSREQRPSQSQDSPSSHCSHHLGFARPQRCCSRTQVLAFLLPSTARAPRWRAGGPGSSQPGTAPRQSPKPSTFSQGTEVGGREVHAAALLTAPSPRGKGLKHQLTSSQDLLGPTSQGLFLA